MLEEVEGGERNISIHTWLKLHTLCLSISNSNWFEFFLSFTVEINVLKYFLDIGKASITSFTYSPKHSWIYSGLPLWECIFIVLQWLHCRASRIFKPSVYCCSFVCPCAPISPSNLLARTSAGESGGTKQWMSSVLLPFSATGISIPRGQLKISGRKGFSSLTF